MTVSQLYTKYKESLLSDSPDVDLDGDTIKAIPVNLGTDYAFSAAHQFLSSVTGYSGATAQTLGSKGITAGVFTAAEVTFAALAASGSKTVDAIVIYKDTGSASTSPLVGICIDGITPVLPNGGDITTSGFATKIFSIG